MRARLLPVALIWIAAGPVLAACEDVPCDRGGTGDLDPNSHVEAADLSLSGQSPAQSSDATLLSLHSRADLNGDGPVGSSAKALASPAVVRPEPISYEAPSPQTPDTSVPALRVGEPHPMYDVFGSSGEFHLEADDLRIRGRGMELVWSRTYRSQAGSDTPMGRGWDFSFNIWIEPAGTDIRLHDGRGGSDVLVSQADGTWSRRGLFAVLEKDQTSGFALSFDHGRRWRFRNLDGSATAGRLDRIVDRNGNTIAFSYDEKGRLITLHDTLDSSAHDRDVTVGYNEDGYIESVTDFTGRRVVYRYYSEGQSDGGAGDLRSASSPPVVDTPNGNDFPDGNTVTYTYSQGYGDEPLNHNLLTVTDAKGQTWLLNTYSSDPDTADELRFDRVVRQLYGGPDDRIDTVYQPVTASAENGWATRKATVNDRAGNVRVFYHDVRSRLVLQREYTGRAEHDRPTHLDLQENLPVKPLRENAPALFETRYEYNDDSLCTRIVRPEGDSEQFVYDASNANLRERGHLLRRVRLPGPLVADQAQLAETFEYDPQSGQLARRIDPRGSETLYSYDETGNCIRVQHAESPVVEYFEYNAFGQLTARLWPDYGGARRRRDEFAYYATGRQRGLLQSQTLDASGLASTTSYQYDLLGRLIRKTDARGQDELYTWNAVDRVVRETSREVSPGSGVRYERDYSYDANGNLVGVDAPGLDEQGKADSDRSVAIKYEYDILNGLVRKSQRVSDEQTVSSEYVYDRNHNLALVRFGEATSGHQPAHTVTTFYDERDLPFRMIRAAGDPSQSTTQYDYDGDRRVRRIAEGVENPAASVTLMTYDGFGRLLRRTDAMGNEESRHYDAAGNLVGRRIDGELNDVPGGAANVRLAETVFEYDEMNRLFRRIEKFFDPQTQAPLADGEAITRFEYTDSGRVRRVLDDLGNATLYGYDALGRCVLMRDARGNTVAWGYDGNSNLVGTTETERSDLGRPERTLTRTFEYDGLDRLSRAVDAAGHARQYLWDSAGKCVLATDPRGHQTRYVHDGMGRLLQTLIDMNGNGASASDAADISISQRWDDSGRLLSRTDANLNTTSYGYDPLSRQAVTRLADGTSWTSVFDVLGRATSITDPNGNVIRSTYDRLGRLIGKTIARGAGVGGTTAESYAYDGLSRLVSGIDDDSTVVRQYDSLNHLIVETEVVGPGGPSRVVGASYDSLGRRVALRYPGGRLITAGYDSLGRPLAIRDETAGESSLIAAYSYLGRRHVERRELGNGARLDLSHGEDGRVSALRYASFATELPLMERTYAWDATGNCSQEQTSTGSGVDARQYFHDAAGRLIESQRSAVGSIISYTLDGAGNRTNVSDGPDVGAYLLDPSTPEPADLQMNQYTAVPAQPRTYDRDGNLTTAGAPRRFSYDYRGQLIELTDLSAGVTVLYKYDVFGRRIEKNVGGVITRHYFAGAQEIEEQAPTNITITTFVQPVASAFGPFEDAGLLQIGRGGQRWFPLSDCMGTCLALTNSSGNIVERYDYGDFGRPAFNDANGASTAASLIGNAFLFRGCRFDVESGLYQMAGTSLTAGARVFDPASGRLISRDRPDPWARARSLGNAYTVWQNNPVSPQPDTLLEMISR